MKTEIKEIVRRMNNLIEHQFDKEYHTECDLFKDIQCLLDYITNLQEENESLERVIEKDTKFYKHRIEDYVDYKSRIKKALKYLPELRKSPSYELDEKVDDLAYILDGGSKKTNTRPKFYTLEDMTQEDLNKLALERNVLSEQNKDLQEELEKYKFIEALNKYYKDNEVDHSECKKRTTEALLKEHEFERDVISKYCDAKVRINKAIEYIHNHQPVFELSSKEQIQEWFEKEYYAELLNILNGGDDNG